LIVVRGERFDQLEEGACDLHGAVAENRIRQRPGNPLAGEQHRDALPGWVVAADCRYSLSPGGLEEQADRARRHPHRIDHVGVLDQASDAGTQHDAKKRSK
jgi:hypothetical protein